MHFLFFEVKTEMKSEVKDLTKEVSILSDHNREINLLIFSSPQLIFSVPHCKKMRNIEHVCVNICE